MSNGNQQEPFLGLRSPEFLFFAGLTVALTGVAVVGSAVLSRSPSLRQRLERKVAKLPEDF
jgi:hypothetical protein